MVVARALFLKPKLLIADEPVSMVDASLRATILETLHALNREHSKHHNPLYYPRSDNSLSRQRPH